MTEELVGRAEALARVGELMSEPQAAVLLVGEAGVGKTALVDHLLPEAPRGGAFSALSWVTHLALQRALPELQAEVWTGDAEYVADEVLRALAGRTLVVEDVQWADHSSRSVIALLTRRTPIIATLRQGDPAAEAVESELATAGFAAVPLEPLSPPAASELALRLNPGLAGGRVAQVVSVSGGNPLIIEELSREEGADTLRLALSRRLDPLTEQAREGMLLLAAAGRPLDADVVPGAAELRTAGLVTDVDDHLLGARHGLVAEVIMADAALEARADAHRTLAGHVTAEGERARHLLAVGELRAAYEAARVAILLAVSPDERSIHLETAAACASDEERDDLLVEAAHEANQALDAPRALTLLQQVAPSRAARADVVVERGVALFEVGDVDGWQQSVRDGLAAEGTPAERSYFRVEEAAVAYFVEGDPAKAADLAATTALDAAEAGLPRAGALRMQGSAQYLLGDPAWPATMEEALAAARGEHDVSGIFSCLNNLVTAHESAGDPREAARRCEEAIAEAAGQRLGRWARHMQTRRLSLALHAGEYALVGELAATLLSHPLADRSREEVVCALALSQIDVGRAEEALRLADLHLAGSGLRPSDYHVVRAQAFLAIGRARAALSEQEPFLAAEPVQSMATAMAPVFAWAAYFAGQPSPSQVTELLDWGMLAGVGPELAGIESLRCGQPEEAAGQFQEAADRYDVYTARSALRCRWAHADALIQSSRRAEGAAAMSEVESTARSLGLAPILRLVARSRGGGEADVRAGSSVLTDAERCVLDLVGDGLSDADIASRLGSSRRTVQSQVASAQRKLGATNRHHAVRLMTEEEAG
jgi:DNA-binding CsgD family transcriptional regulator/tetratricopeptide (TPR) repeat protein